MSHRTDQNEGNPILSDLGATEFFLSLASMQLVDALTVSMRAISEKEDPSGFELYAKRLISHIDLDKLREISTVGSVSLARIELMDAFYINYDRKAVSPHDARLLYALESILNRLSKIADTITGEDLPPRADGVERICANLDIEQFRIITGYVDRLMEKSIEPNPWASPGTIACTPGGEWDIRSRFASLVEHLSLVTRLDYTYRVDAKNGVMAVNFLAPQPEDLPAEEAFSGTPKSTVVWKEILDTDREALALEHGFRMALVLAGACFASGLGIHTCYVQMDNQAKPNHSRFMKYEREDYLARLVPLARTLTGTSLRDGRCTTELAPLCIDQPMPQLGSTVRDAQPKDDPRDLPECLRRLLMADKASELEVMEDEDSPYNIRIKELREHFESDPAESAEGLIKLTEEISAACVVAELQSSGAVQTQFCENHLGRLLLPLFEDDPTTRILRAPDALFFAESDLATMYLKSGNYTRALDELHRLLDVSVTSTQAHLLLISALSLLERFDEITEVVKHGLRCAYDRETISYYFYRVAFAYWQLGRIDVALACYSLVPRGEQVSEVADEELRALCQKEGLSGRLDFSQAVEVARAEGIPVPPTEEFSNRIADLAVLLVDNGFFFLAIRCVYCMWRTMGRDELGAINRSLQPGIAHLEYGTY